MTQDKAAVTAGPWHISYENVSTYAICANDGQPEAPWTICKGTPGIRKSEAKGNASLILTAVNACFSLSPNNPLIAAEAIGEMYALLEEAIPYLPFSDTARQTGLIDRARALLQRLEAGR